jgi:hypothetical protein
MWAFCEPLRMSEITGPAHEIIGVRPPSMIHCSRQLGNVVPHG